jgi:hypothetical protein
MKESASEDKIPDGTGAQFDPSTHTAILPHETGAALAIRLEIVLACLAEFLRKDVDFRKIEF